MEDQVGNGGGSRYYSSMIRERPSSSHEVDHHQARNKPSCSRLLKPTFRKVQVVYYLTKNGQLEHPHFMEVTHLLHHQLRLKDVMERLTLLRGRGMPSLYSWSCKRSYKNGYVWNDLGENDIICPTDGAEYVLKGSELIQENLEHLQVDCMQKSVQDPTNFHSKRMPVALKRHVHEHPKVGHNKYEEDEDQNHQEPDETTVEIINYAATTPSRCSRGVSTDELEFLHQQQTTASTHKTELTLDLHSSSPPSTTSCESNNDTSKRFEDGDPVVMATDSVFSRNSVLLQLIACGGGSMGFNNKGKGAGGCGSSCVPVVKQPPSSPPLLMVAGRKSTSSLRKVVLCKTTAEETSAVAVGDEDELADEIRCMSENPRFGNLQVEEKEYFSGSIVEAMTAEGRGQIEPRLKKSSSYNEERRGKSGLEAAEEEINKREKVGVVGKLIQRKKSSSRK